MTRLLRIWNSYSYLKKFGVKILCVLLFISACRTKTPTTFKNNIPKTCSLSVKLSATENSYKVGKANEGYFIFVIKNNNEYVIENFSFQKNIVFSAHCEESMAPLHLNIYNDIILSRNKEITPEGFFQTTLKFDDLFRNKISKGSNAQKYTGWYWTWSPHIPEPPTPLHKDQDNLCKEVVFWYVVIVNGVEFASNKVKLVVEK